MVRLDGRYYMFGSHLTGWDPNDSVRILQRAELPSKVNPTDTNKNTKQTNKQVCSTSTSQVSDWSSWQTFAGTGSNTYASRATYSGGAKDVGCSGCSGGKAVGYIGGPYNPGKISFSGVKSDAGGLTTVKIRHNSGDTNRRHAQVTVNASLIKLVFANNGGNPSTSTLNINLKAGSDNTVVFEGINGDFGVKMWTSCWYR